VADNVEVPLPDGTTTNVPVATDDVSGVQFQKVKLDIGGDGVSVPVTDLATSAKQDTANTALASLVSQTDGIETALGTLATQTTAAAILAKLIAAPATEAKQTTGNASLGSIDGKLPALVSSKVPVQTDERPSASAAAITPHDTNNFAGGVCRGIYVGVGGNIVAIVNGTAVTFKGAAAGSVLPIAATRVNATSTTATDLVALY
jgi:hypothetical protein